MRSVHYRRKSSQHKSSTPQIATHAHATEESSNIPIDDRNGNSAVLVPPRRDADFLDVGLCINTQGTRTSEAEVSSHSPKTGSDLVACAFDEDERGVWAGPAAPPAHPTSDILGGKSD